MQNLIDKINAHPRATLLVAGTGIFTVAAAVILVMFVSLKNTLEAPPVVTPEEEKMVLSEVIKNNPKEIINNTQNPGSGTSTPEPIPAQTPVPVPSQQPVGNSNPTAPQPAPDLTQYNYRVTKVSNSKGPGYDLCRPSYPDYGMGGGYGSMYGADSTVTEYKEYFERYLSYYKSETKENNNLSNYYISKYGRDVSNYTNYMGGNYAVETLYSPYTQFDNQNDTQEVSYPVGTASELITYYFGNNASIVEVQTDASGNKYYIVQNSYNTYCDVNYDPYLLTDQQPPVQKKMINIYKVNGKTFSIEQKKMYLDVVRDQNLLSVYTYDVNRSKVTLNQVASQFNLPVGVTVVTRDYRNHTYSFDYYKDLAEKVDYLATKGSVLTNPAGNFGLSYLSVYGFTSSQNTYPNEYKDRAFFPATTWGDTLFERFNQVSQVEKEQSYTAYFSQYGGVGFSISEYLPSITMDTVISRLLEGRSTSRSVSDGQLLIDATPTNVKKITKVFTYLYPVSYTDSYPGSYPASYATTHTYTTNYYVFEYNGRVYVEYFYNYSGGYNLEGGIDLSIYPLFNSTLVTEAKTLLTNLYSYYLNIISPVSYPTSFPVSYGY